MSASGAPARNPSATLHGVELHPSAEEITRRFRDRLGIIIPALNEADNLALVLRRIPSEVCGVPTAVLVVDDGSNDDTAQVSLAEGAAVARHVVNRGGGAALRTGFGLLIEAGARLIVTMDADGQHRPEEMAGLVEPVVVHDYDIAYGSRVLGHAEANAYARELGIAFFNRLVTLMTRTKVTDCSNGYRAIRTTVIPRLVLRQEQFHTSEFLIESLKKGLRTTEVPVTVARRHSGKSKKPKALRYGWGFASAIFRTWLRRSGDPVAIPVLPGGAPEAAAVRDPDPAHARALGS